jgi:hypothetical protein
VNLTDAQKDLVKEAIYQFAQAQVQNEANVKKAFLSADHTFMSATSAKADGQAAQASLIAAISTTIKAKADLDLAVTYDILQPAQRENALICARIIQGQHPGGPGPGPGAGPGPGPRP